MPKFMTDMIKAQILISLEAGKEKYRVLFINTAVYARYKVQVDTNLTSDGFADCIVTE